MTGPDIASMTLSAGPHRRGLGLRRATGRGKPDSEERREHILLEMAKVRSEHTESASTPGSSGRHHPGSWRVSLSR